MFHNDDVLLQFEIYCKIGKNQSEYLAQVENKVIWYTYQP